MAFVEENVPGELSEATCIEVEKIADMEPGDLANKLGISNDAAEFIQGWIEEGLAGDEDEEEEEDADGEEGEE